MVKLLAFILLTISAVSGTPLSKFGENFHPDGRIIGGRNADIADYPYQLSILHGDQTYVCGAILIAEDWALTAAHCTTKHEALGFFVRAGSSHPESGGEVIEVEKVFEDPVPSMTKDISLLKLSSKVPATAAKPIELAISNPKGGEIATVTGWGLSDTDEGIYPNVLQAVDVPIVSSEDCKEANEELFESETMVCAGFLDKGGKGICSGDAGGPLAVDGKLVGIVSWSLGCAVPGKPGIFISVPSFLDWIKEIMSSNQ